MNHSSLPFDRSNRTPRFPLGRIVFSGTVTLRLRTEEVLTALVEQGSIDRRGAGWQQREVVDMLLPLIARPERRAHTIEHLRPSKRLSGGPLRRDKRTERSLGTIHWPDHVPISRTSSVPQAGSQHRGRNSGNATS